MGGGEESKRPPCEHLSFRKTASGLVCLCARYDWSKSVQSCYFNKPSPEVDNFYRENVLEVLTF